LPIHRRLTVLSLVLACSSLPSTPVRPVTATAISAADLRTRLFIFADDSMLGRNALDRPGDERATNYLAAELKRMGLIPAGEQGTYFQTFSIHSRRLDSTSLIMVGDAVLHPTADFKVFLFDRGQPRAIEQAQVIFGGVVGDTSTQISAADAARRFVLLGVPAGMTAEHVYANVLYGPASRFKDAVAVAIASLDYLPPHQRTISSSVALADTTEPLANAHPISILVSHRVADLLLGSDMDHAKAGTIGRAVTAKLAINEADYPTRNVIAVIPGSDSTLKNEYVALGAHSDHLGISTRALEHDSVRVYAIETQRRRQEGTQTSSVRVNVDSLRRIRAARPDSIYNGADDDGSGSVALLEIAERFAAARQHPRRSLLFVWHAAEEMGLVGSGWFTDHPTVPLDSVIAQLNLDMVGRGDASDLRSGGPRYLEVIGSGRRSSALHDAIEAVNTASESPLSLNTLDPNGVFCRSDHWSYARFGIPIAFFTTGLHADYHQVTDEAQYIDYAKLERVTQFVSEVARALAGTSARFEPLGKRPVFAPFCTG
jgi:hypothetical protein